MKRLFCLLLVLSVCSCVYSYYGGSGGLRAQIGAGVHYNFRSMGEAPVFDDVALGEFVEDGLEYSLNYWFRLPNKRVEFLPSLYYSRQSPSLNGDISELGFALRTSLYIFDFGGDCDCPTFGKQGPQLQKGFFVQLSPGYSINRVQLPIIEDETFSSWNLGVGAGLDIGLSNLITVTPEISYRYYPEGVLKKEIVGGDGTMVETDRLSLVRAGIRVGIRLDAKNY